MRAIIVDDEQLNIDLIRNFIDKYAPFIEVADVSREVDDAIEKILQQEPDLLFLDVEIHKRKGFEILQVVPKSNMMVVMVTAYEKYAIEAIDHSVVGYLLKPIQLSEFLNVTNKCKKLFEEEKEKGSDKDDPRFIPVHLKDHVVILPVDNIIRLEAHGNYTTIFTSIKQKYTTSKQLKYYENNLPESKFIRIHHSHLININHISKMSRDKNPSLILDNQEVIPVSAAGKKVIQKRLFI